LLSLESVHIEISSKCTLKCPRCPRTELELDYLNQEITLSQFKTGFPINVIQQIKQIIFCGHTGDPIYATEFLEIVNYIKQNSNCRIHIITNGSYKKSNWWQELGRLLDATDRVTFSVDGWDNFSNNQYRINSDFNSIVDAVATLRQASPCYIIWSTIYFAFNFKKINDIKRLAQTLGCNEFKTVKSSKFDGDYSVNGIDMLKPDSKFVAETLVYEVESINLDHNYIPITRSTPDSPHPWAKCVNYEKDLFVSVTGLVFPCPWFDNGYQHNNFVDQNKDQLSLYNRPLDVIINDRELWNKLKMRFESDPLEICQLKCKNA